jgi:stalled ribosome alternative rescue factor ArfA
MSAAKKMVQRPIYRSRVERDRKNNYRRQAKHRKESP